MGSFLDRLREKSKNQPHVGIPPVTNPKLPTKVERDAAEFAARQKDMPKFVFGTGTPLEQLKARMANAPHPTPTCADPKFNNDNNKICISQALIEAWESEFQDFFKKEVAKKAKQKQDAQKA